MSVAGDRPCASARTKENPNDDISVTCDFSALSPGYASWIEHLKSYGTRARPVEGV